jgi:iron complex outermembrane recepter protein
MNSRQHLSVGRSRVFHWSGLVSVAGLLCLQVSQAAELPDELVEIVVTAQFRESNLQDTPLAITALTAEALAERSAGSVIDVEKFAPNVTINHLGTGWGPTMAASIRGLSSNDFKAVFEQAVPLYVDDVLLARPTAATLDLLDLERVEVLRGPQGTLFGANAVGGVIRMVTRKPTGNGPSSIEVTAGSYDRIDVRGSFETTLIPERVFARVSASAKRRSGYVDVLDFTCEMRRRGTPQLAGIGDGIGGWDRTTNTPIMVAVGSQADNLFAIPTETSPNGTDRGCKIDEMGDEDVQSARAALRYIANDKIEFNFTGDITDQNSKSPADKLVTTANVGLVQTFNRLVANPSFGVPYDNRFVTDDPFTIYSTFQDPVGIIFDPSQTPGSTQRQGLFSSIDTPNKNNFKHWGVSGAMDWTFTDRLALKTILSYRTWDAYFGRDSDGSPLPGNHTLDTVRSDQMTAEMRLSGKLGITEWTLGGFYLDLEDFNSNISVLWPGTNSTGDIDRIDIQTRDNIGFFVHTINELTDRLSITAGIRWSQDDKEVVQIRSSRDAVFVGAKENCNLAAGTLVFPCKPIAEKSSRVTPALSVQYEWTDDLTSYASWSRGYRGGGFNPRPNSTATVTAFGPEDLDSFELGFKSDLFDNRLRLNLAAFFMIYKDLQVPGVVQEPGQPVAVFVTTNAGKAHIPGAEVEFQMRLTQGLTLEGSVGYLDFEYKDLGQADPALVTANGFNAIANPCITCKAIRTPEWTGSLGASYRVNLSGGSSLQARADWSVQSRVFFAANNAPRASQAGYGTVDARITWNSSDDTWSTSVFGTNLTDKVYRVSVLDFFDSLGSVEAGYGRPREYGISIRRKF